MIVALMLLSVAVDTPCIHLSQPIGGLGIKEGCLILLIHKVYTSCSSKYCTLYSYLTSHIFMEPIGVASALSSHHCKMDDVAKLCVKPFTSPCWTVRDILVLTTFQH